jgi:hypothetical protein
MADQNTKPIRLLLVCLHATKKREMKRSGTIYLAVAVTHSTFLKALANAELEKVLARGYPYP